MATETNGPAVAAQVSEPSNVPSASNNVEVVPEQVQTPEQKQVSEQAAVPSQPSQEQQSQQPTQQAGGTEATPPQPKQEQQKPEAKTSEAAAAPPQPKQQKPKQQQPAAQQAGEAAGEKKLSNAELKKKAKEEKAARRAQAKVAQTSQSPAAQSSSEAKGGKGKGKPDGAPQQQQQQQQQQAKGAAVKQAVTAAPKKPKSQVPECFSHLSIAKRIPYTQADNDVHPSVLLLGQHMSTFELSHATARTEATLLAFKKVLESYTPPHGTSFSRHFTSHVLNPQIDYLTACRPMCFSMGNFIRWLKLQISKMDIDVTDSEAIKVLSRDMDAFLEERIHIPIAKITETAVAMIKDQDETILTFAHHPLVEKVLLTAKRRGKDFRVILVDDVSEPVGVAHANTLVKAGIPVTYATNFGALRYHLEQSTRVLIGAEAMFSNGAMYARAGTSDIALNADDFGTRIVALCETINFTDRVAIDSLTYNEIDPERCTDEEFRLLFDTTPEKLLSVVVTEFGNTSPISVPGILRKLDQL